MELKKKKCQYVSINILPSFEISILTKQQYQPYQKTMNKTFKNVANNQFQKIIPKVQSSKLLKTYGHRKRNSNLSQQMIQSNNYHQISKQSVEKAVESTLLNSKSFPNILNENGYIKIDPQKNYLAEKVANKFFRSPSKTQSNFRVYQSLSRQQYGSATRIATEESREPKFKRKKTIKFQAKISSFLESDLNNLKETTYNMNQLLQDNTNLKKKLNQSQKHIEELTLKLFAFNKKNYSQKVQILEKSIKQLEQKLNMKEAEIRQLNQRNQKNEKQIMSLTKKIADLTKQNQNCKAFTFNMNESSNLNSDVNMDLDNSGIGFQMLSTAQYIGSLTDLQDQVHNKNKQIFDLNKVIEQLKIKQHVSQLKHEENLRRNSNQWQTKYKRLLNSYKELKAMKAATGFMLKKKASIQCLSKQKEDYFNLSLSTDRSQVPNM